MDRRNRFGCSAVPRISPAYRLDHGRWASKQKVTPASSGGTSVEELQRENESLRRVASRKEIELRRAEEQMHKLRGGDTINSRSEDLKARMRKKRLAVSAEAISKERAKAMDTNEFSPPVYPKSESTQGLLMDAVYESILFNVDANPVAAQAFVQAFNGPEEVGAGTEIITQGQARRMPQSCMCLRRAHAKFSGRRRG